MTDSLPRWRSRLDGAIEANTRDRASRDVQLATTAPDGSPAVRTAIVRGFLDAARPYFVTDGRSRKIAHVRADARVALCWYLRHTLEQFRLSGHAVVVGPDDDDAMLADARHDAWVTLNERTRRQFLWPEPAASRADDETFAEADDTALPDDPPDNFVLVVVEVVLVDHLRLEPWPHRRTIHRLDDRGGWTEEETNP